jgi:predicted Zn-dependent protease with MMP-like domain
MDAKQIIMNYTVAPSAEDIQAIAGHFLEAIPEELAEFCEGLAIQVEELPDTSVEQELDLEDPYDLLALYKSGGEISPGVQKKIANDDDILIIYRRPLLDMWCESGDDIGALVRQVMIEELGRHFEFSDDEIDDMTRQHYQGML